VIGVVVACCPTLARTQIIAPVLDRHALELGYAYRWCHRDATPPPLAEIRWEVATFYARFGLFDWLSADLEGGLWEVESDEFPQQVFDRYVVGGGVTARVWSANDWASSVSLNYTEVWDDDESAYGFDKRVYRLTAIAPISRQFRLGVPLDTWIGPCYLDDTIENYRYNDSIAIEDEPETHWGLAGGLQAVLWGHVTILGYAQYVDYVEGLVGIGFRVGGEK
jgi:hypothetical protein